jgi:hypothetical protein
MFRSENPANAHQLCFGNVVTEKMKQKHKESISCGTVHR